jgi:hypothetical protein
VWQLDESKLTDAERAQIASFRKKYDLTDILDPSTPRISLDEVLSERMSFVLPFSSDHTN